MKRFRIPNVDVLLNELEVKIAHTRQFQRLFYLRQLGLAYLVYPGATHTRGVHSIETLYQATRILDALKANGQRAFESEKEQNDYRAIRLAALLHDIGHIPFSHTLEDEHCVLKKHDGRERVEEAFQLLLVDLGSITDDERRDLDEAKKILISVSEKDAPERGEYVKDWRSDIVGNTICADLLAYINADSAWTGIEKRSGHYRIYDYFVLKDEVLPPKNDAKDAPIRKRTRLCIQLTKNGVLRTDVVSAILDILGIRYTLTERVLFHHAKCTASAMLARAARLCNFDDDDCHCLREARGEGGVKSQRSLLRMGDEAFFDLLEERAYSLESEKDQTSVSRLVQQLRSRNLYKRIFKVSTRARDAQNDGRADSFSTLWRERDRVESTLSTIEDTLDLPRGSLVLWCSDPNAGKKLVRVNVVWESDDCTKPVELRDPQIERRFPTVYKRVKAVEEQYDDLWCLWVAIDRAQIAKAPAVIQMLESKLGVSCDKMFKETYLRAALKITPSRDHINRRLSDFYVALSNEVADQVIAVSGLDGKDEDYSDQLIMTTLRGVIENRTKDLVDEQPGKRRSRKSPGQLEIGNGGDKNK